MSMRISLLTLALLTVLAVTGAAEKLDLGSGKSAQVSVPDTWKKAGLPPTAPGLPAVGTTIRYVTKNGSNDAVLITLLSVPDDRFAESDNLQALIEESTQQFAAGSVEGKAILKEIRIAGKSGYYCTFTDANLVGQPTAPDDYKTLTSCFVYLGDEVLLTATVFSDDVSGKAYADGLRLLKSLTLHRAKDNI
jgi:hypothetical protein